MQQSMSKCLDALKQDGELGQDCERTFRREFHKRLAIMIVCVALGVIGVLTHFA